MTCANPARLIVPGVMVGLAGVGLMSAIADDDPNERPVMPDEAVLPVINRWVDWSTGAFWNPDGAWDNRIISDEEKAKSPWYDPRWKPFSDCMVAEGFEVRASASEPFAQKDLDALFVAVNEASPDGQANKKLGPAGPAPGVTGAFLKCADRWLTIGPDDYEKNGVTWLEPGELPEP